MRMGQGVRTGLGHGGITCGLTDAISSCNLFLSGLLVMYLIGIFNYSSSSKGEWALFMGKQICNFLVCFPSLWGSTQKGKNGFIMSKFFSLRVESI